MFLFYTLPQASSEDNGNTTEEPKPLRSYIKMYDLGKLQSIYDRHPYLERVCHVLCRIQSLPFIEDCRATAHCRRGVGDCKRRSRAGHFHRQRRKYFWSSSGARTRLRGGARRSKRSKKMLFFAQVDYGALSMPETPAPPPPAMSKQPARVSVSCQTLEREVKQK